MAGPKFRNVSSDALTRERKIRNKMLDDRFGKYNLQRMAEGVLYYLEDSFKKGLPNAYKSMEDKLDSQLFYNDLMYEFSWNWAATFEIQEAMSNERFKDIASNYMRAYNLDLKKLLAKGLEEVSVLG